MRSIFAVRGLKAIIAAFRADTVSYKNSLMSDEAHEGISILIKIVMCVLSDELLDA